MYIRVSRLLMCLFFLVVITSRISAATTFPNISEVILDQTQLVIVPYVSFKLAAKLIWDPTALPPPPLSSILYQVVSQDSTLIGNGTVPIFDDNNNLIQQVSMTNLYLSNTGTQQLVVHLRYDTNSTTTPSIQTASSSQFSHTSLHTFHYPTIN